MHYDAIQITYLGTNGYQLESGGHSLWIDPYFSRISLGRIAFGQPIRPDQPRIAQGTTRLNKEVDAIVVTHGHFDHLLDVPVLMKQTGAAFLGSETAVELASRAGGDPNKCKMVSPGMRQTIGPWTINVLRASHDRLLMIGVPFNRRITATTPPRRAHDWVCGQPLSYLISANGLTVFIDSGGTPAVIPPAQVGPVDLAILGMALPDSRARFAATVTTLRPRYILPSHQDDFFTPLDRGFQFGLLTDFPSVRREHEIRHLPGRLILLDYFRPWTIATR